MPHGLVRESITRRRCFLIAGAGLGFGHSMKDALMLIAYTAGKNKSGMDNSLQVAKGTRRA